MFLKEIHDMDDEYMEFYRQVKLILHDAGAIPDGIPENWMKRDIKSAWNQGEVPPEEVAQYILRELGKS